MTIPARPYKVLIVEDEPDILALVKETLHHERVEILEAADGELGLQIATDGTPDLILLDIMLPKLNGYEVCRRLKSNDKTTRIPVLLLTALSQKREIEEGFKVKADGYILKPFEPMKLRQQVQAYLEHTPLQ